MDFRAMREEFSLRAWDPNAVAPSRALCMRAAGAPYAGYQLLDDDGACFAWLDHPGSTGFAPAALTAATVLAIGRERRGSRRLLVVDQHSRAPLCTIVPHRLRPGADLEPALGTRRRLVAAMLSSDWRLRDDAGATVLEIAQGKDDGRRLSFRGDPHHAPDIIVLLATAFHVLMSGSLLGGGGGGGGA